uniref:SANT domain-containing protein n=1 Tax=Caenorhabditis tropicalis TaxID=1561998 RepID=A0A1I7UUW3_9PELO
MFQPVTHVIFDFDGLLVDTESAYTEANMELLRKYGKVFTMDLKRRQMGKRHDESIRWLINELQIGDQVTPEEYSHQYDAILIEMFKRSPAMPGAEKLVRHLIHHGIPVALCTGSCSRTFPTKLDNHRDWVNMIALQVLSGDDPEVKYGKPHPDPFLVTMRRFPKVPETPQHVLVFEDSYNGKALKTSKMTTEETKPDITPDPPTAKEPASLEEAASLEDANTLSANMEDAADSAEDALLESASSDAAMEAANTEDAIQDAEDTLANRTSSDPSTSSPTEDPVQQAASRRRIAFVLRERPLPLHVKSEAEPHAPPTTTEPSTSTSTSEADLLLPHKLTRNPWNMEEVNVFYEGLKLYGKDFDNVQKFMVKRKVFKSKEHIKIFFNNSVKSYRTLLSLTDDDLSTVPRDARELFLLINACEWKRKTLNMKIIIEKFRELIYEGQVVVKAGRRLVTIRTPPCHTLSRYFTCKKATTFPETVYIQLEPTSNGDHVFMRNRDQNPYLRVKLNTNDRIMKLLEFLHRKWASAGDSSPISVTLWPDTSCEIASLCVSTAEASPFISISLNKLLKNVEEHKEKTEPKKEGGGLKLGTDVNIKTKSTYSLVYPKPFVLNDKVIAEGITCRNIRNAIVAELYCVCGRKNPIKLRYQVQSERPESRSTTEPWRTLINLLDKGYGDCLATKEVIQKKRPPPPPSSSSVEVCSRKPPPPAKKRHYEPRPLGSPGNPESDIVRQENDDFASQLALLKKTTRQMVVGANRKSTNPAIATRTPQLSIRPPEVPAPAPDTAESLSKTIFAAPKCKKQQQQQPPKAKKSLTSSPTSSAQPSTSQHKSLPIDFSSVVFSPAKQRNAEMELQKQRTEDFLSSLKTPNDTPTQTPQKSTFQQLFGDELSMSPNSTRHASQFETMDSTNA